MQNKSQELDLVELTDSKEAISLTKSIKTLVLKASFILLFIFALGLIVLPFLPELMYSISAHDNVTPDYPVSYSVNKFSIQSQFYITDGNRLFIPRIGVDAKILEGSSVDVLLQAEGVWREPDTSTPDALGNMVLAGHRFQYLPPNTSTFYNLDKLEIGDVINIYWHGKEYVYTIYKTYEVYPNQSEIKSQNVEKNEITLYTCTPIYTSEKRLVIKAKLI